MKFRPTEIPDVVLVELDVHRDARGFFVETWHQRKYAEAGIDARFVQDNHSRSVKSTVRGLHAQRRHPQGKLVRAVRGEVYDVAVDIRRGSPHFGRYVGVTLCDGDGRQLWIPVGFAHGFAVLSDEAEIEYKCTDFYAPGDELAIAWNDPALAIPWPVDDPIVSEKDRSAPRLAEVASLLPSFSGGRR